MFEYALGFKGEFEVILTFTEECERMSLGLPQNKNPFSTGSHCKTLPSDNKDPTLDPGKYGQFSILWLLPFNDSRNLPPLFSVSYILFYISKEKCL